jgi:phosphatidylglycerophosphate synthase
MTPHGSRTIADSLTSLRGAQKSSKGAPIYSLLVNRPLGRVFAALAHQARMTPNQVTAVSAVFTLGGIALIATVRPTWFTGVIIALALVLGYALDSADGQLARLRGGGSLTGEWLDHVIDSFKIATLHLAVLVMAYRHFTTPEWWLIVPLVFSATYVVHFFGMLLSDLLARLHSTTKPTAGGTQSRIMPLLKLPTDYGLLCVIFVLLGITSWFVVVYTLLALAMVGYTALVLPKWYRDVRKLDSARTLGTR